MKPMTVHKSRSAGISSELLQQMVGHKRVSAPTVDNLNMGKAFLMFSVSEGIKTLIRNRT